MLGKKTLPVVGKLAGTWSSINRTGFSDTGASQTSSPEYKIPSPRGLKNYDLGGIGLGIVAALEKSDQIQANKAVFVQNLTRSNPIPVKKPADSRCRGASESEEIEMDSLEDYTFVTFNGPNKTYTRVYCDRGDDYCGGKSGYHRRRSIFDVSAAGLGEDHFAEYPVSDFLSSCNLCKKKLHGKDIYMYRGDKAFCSTECRYREMITDERKEKCRSEAASRPSTTDVSNSPYANGQIFSPGILAI